jgi:hypothetical protein
MANKYILLPRSLEKNPHWIASPLSHRNVFIYVLYRSVIYEYPYLLGTLTINLGPGQYANTMRRLTEEYNLTVPKVDRITKSTMDRILNRFHKCGFWNKKTIKDAGQPMGQGTGQGKGQSTGQECTIITQTFPDIYEQFQKSRGTEYGTGCGTGVNSDSGTLTDLANKLSLTESCSSNEKIVSILEGWDFEKDLRPLSLTIVREVTSNNNIHYRTLHTTDSELSDANFIEFVIEYAAACGFNESTLFDLQNKKYSIERVFLSIYKLQGRKGIQSKRAVLFKICEDEDFQDLKNNKTKRRLKTLPKTETRSSNESNVIAKPDIPPINPKRVHRFTTMDKVSGIG